MNNHYSHRRYEKSISYNKREQDKQKIVLPFVKGIKNLIVPEELYFIGKGEDGYPEPYRLQAFQNGSTFDSIQDFWIFVTPQQIKVIRELIQADLKFNNQYGYHLDLIGFRSDHTPTLEEIAEVYKNPFPRATNLLFLPNGNVAWVDPKTSNLTPEKNLIRAKLLKELLTKI